MTGPTLQAFGTQKQKDLFLGPILTGDVHNAWAGTVHGHLGGRPPAVDLGNEKKLAELLHAGLGPVQTVPAERLTTVPRVLLPVQAATPPNGPSHGEQAAGHQGVGRGLGDGCRDGVGPLRADLEARERKAVARIVLVDAVEDVVAVAEDELAHQFDAGPPVA